MSINESLIGKKCVVRTYSAGCWFGTVEQKEGHEIILANARRMHSWWAAESYSLSAVALYGLKHDRSGVIAAVPAIWLEAIELIPATDVAIKSIEGAQNAKAR